MKRIAKKNKPAGRPQTRSRDATCNRLVQAVGSLLARCGFKALGVNAVAREAGVDKVLIYRYFGGMPELLRVFGESETFWPSMEEITGSDLEKLKILPPAQGIALVMKNYIHAILRRPLTREIIAWEIVERNELTQILENIREETSRKLFALFGPEIQAIEADVPAITALLAAAVNYLSIRSRDIQTFNTVDIAGSAGWLRIEKAVTAVCESCFIPRKSTTELQSATEARQKSRRRIPGFSL